MSLNSTERPPAVGIDFGGTSVKIAVTRGSELLTEVRRLVTSDYSSAMEMIQAWVELVAELRKEVPEISAVGIGIPGFVDWERGLARRLTNVPGWANTPVREIVSRSIDLPIAVENDAKCMTYAEFTYGAAQGFTDAIAITLGTGVGGGLILNGKLHRGRANGAGEIGQMSIDFRGPAGVYANPGALEEYVGNRVVIRRAEDLYRTPENPAPDWSPQELSDAALGGDAIAQQIWDEYSTHLAACIANVVWLVNPEAVIVGGGIAKAAPELLLEPLEEKVLQRVDESFREGLQFLPAQFGNDAGIIGSAALAVDFGRTS